MVLWFIEPLGRSDVNGGRWDMYHKGSNSVFQHVGYCGLSGFIYTVYVVCRCNSSPLVTIYTVFCSFDGGSVSQERFPDVLLILCVN